jgi:hypothetical protein
MQITGTIKVIGATQTIGASFQKREFVIVTPEQYPQSIQLEFQGDKCDIIDAYAEGQEVVCDINIRGRLWTNPEGVDKYFTTLVCWKIQPVGGVSQTPNANQFTPQEKQAMDSVGTAPFETVSDVNNDEHDDLPF